MSSDEARIGDLPGTEDPAVVALSAEGVIESWSAAAERLTGYRTPEIVGKHFTAFHSIENLRREKPAEVLRLAASEGRAEYADWHVRKDGSHFWARFALTAVPDPCGGKPAYSVEMGLASRTNGVAESFLARNAELEALLDERTAQLGARTAELGERTAELGVRTAQLGVRTGELGSQTTELGERTVQLSAKTREFNTVEALNKELEAFTYAASHDLRAPLRAIDGFSNVLLEDYGDKLDAEGQGHLQRIRASAQRMGQLIDDLIGLSSLTRGSLKRETCDLSSEARKIAEELQRSSPERKATFVFGGNMVANCDVRLLRIALENLLGNAFKYTSKKEHARIELGMRKTDTGAVFFVRDNGAGFEMKYVHKLFAPFQRLHGSSEFEGNGIGLATVQRIINRHGGEVWAESEVEKGTTLFFTL